LLRYTLLHLGCQTHRQPLNIDKQLKLSGLPQKKDFRFQPGLYPWVKNKSPIDQ